jgi:putative peptidoglycan lipid II flippase
LFLLSDGIVELIFEYGAFDSYATKTVAQVVQILALAGFSYSLVEILSRGFYALSDTKTPVFVAVLAMCVNLVLASLIIGVWGGDVESLIWVIVTSAMFEFVILAVLLHRRAKFLRPRHFAMPAMGIIFGLIALGISVSAVESLLSEMVLTLKIPSLVVIGGMIYTLVTSIFDADLRRRMPYQVFRSIPGAGKSARKS